MNKPTGIERRMPSILSRKPPWPGNKSLVSLTLALRFRKVIKKIIRIVLFSKWLLKKGINIKEKIKEPKEPEIVFFGLIFVNLLPLKTFPNVKPPISEAIEMEMEYMMTILNSGILDSINNIIKTSSEKYNKDIALYIKRWNFFLKIFEIKLYNSIQAIRVMLINDMIRIKE